MAATVELHTTRPAMGAPTVTAFAKAAPNVPLIAGTVLTELSDNPGVYTFSTSLTGSHKLVVYDAGAWRGYQWADIPPSGTVIATDEREGAADQVIIESGITPSAALTNDTGTQLTRINLIQALAVCLSGLAGLLSGGTTAANFKPAGKPAGDDRIDATVVAATGNRTAINLQVPD